MSLFDVAEVATALGVVLVALQLWIGRHQTRTALEDEFSREYRKVALALPLQAFFDSPKGGHLTELDGYLREYLWYIDLTNQQVFLRSQCRISRRTWRLWRDGMRDNLKRREGFKAAWENLSQQMELSFAELRRLDGDWDADPAWWNPPWWRRPFRRYFRRCPSKP